MMNNMMLAQLMKDLQVGFNRAWLGRVWSREKAVRKIQKRRNKTLSSTRRRRFNILPEGW